MMMTVVVTVVVVTVVVLAASTGVQIHGNVVITVKTSKFVGNR